MRRARRSRAMVTLVLGCLLGVPSAFAEVPKQTKEELHQHSTHILRGKVVQTYERKADPAGWHTDLIAEIDVESVEEGAVSSDKESSKIEAGDRVFVRYWRARLKKGETGSAGHLDIPNANDHVLVYVNGDRKRGYNVQLPNGFAEVTKGDSTEKEKVNTD